MEKAPDGTGFDARWKLLRAAEAKLEHTKTLGDAIDVVRQSARAICSADGVTFVLRDGPDCHYVDEDAIAPLWKGLRFPLEACISGWVMEHRQSAVIEDIYADPRIPHEGNDDEVAMGLGLCGMAAAPLRAPGAAPSSFTRKRTPWPGAGGARITCRSRAWKRNATPVFASGDAAASCSTVQRPASDQ